MMGGGYMAIFIVLLVIAAVIFTAGIIKRLSAVIPQKLTEDEERQLPFVLNPELIDYIRRHK